MARERINTNAFTTEKEAEKTWEDTTETVSEENLETTPVEEETEETYTEEKQMEAEEQTAVETEQALPPQPTYKTTAKRKTVLNPKGNVVLQMLNNQATLVTITQGDCDMLYRTKTPSMLLKGIPSNPDTLPQGYITEKYRNNYFLINNNTFNMDAVQATLTQLLSSDESPVELYNEEGRILNDIEAQYVQYLSEGLLEITKSYDVNGELIYYAIRRA